MCSCPGPCLCCLSSCLNLHFPLFTWLAPTHALRRRFRGKPALVLWYWVNCPPRVLSSCCELISVTLYYQVCLLPHQILGIFTVGTCLVDLQATGWQTMVHRGNLACGLFAYSPHARHGFYIFQEWQKNKTVYVRETLYDLRSLKYSLSEPLQKRFVDPCSSLPSGTTYVLNKCY